MTIYDTNSHPALVYEFDAKMIYFSLLYGTFLFYKRCTYDKVKLLIYLDHGRYELA